MSTYASTQVGAYLKARFGFTFSDEPILQRLEDHIWEAARRAQTQRKEVAHVAEGLAQDIAYVVRSLADATKAPYEPNQRGDFAAGVRLCGELEREVQDLVGVHQAVLWALREHLSNVPTLAEHSDALGKLREQEQLLIGKRQEIVELLAAREEWERDEAELTRRLGEAEAQSKNYAARLKATDVATNARIRELEAALKAAQDRPWQND